MPSSLAAVVKRINSLSKVENKTLIQRFVDLMKSADISQKYQKDNLFVSLSYARHLGTKRLSDVDKNHEITDFLDTRRKHCS